MTSASVAGNTSLQNKNYYDSNFDRIKMFDATCEYPHY